MAALTPKERVFVSLNLEEPDRVPIGEFGYINRDIVETILDESYRDTERKEALLREEGMLQDKEWLQEERYKRDFRLKMSFFRKAGLDFALHTGIAVPKAYETKQVNGNIHIDYWGRKWDTSKANDMMPWLVDSPIKSWEDFEKLEIPAYIEDEHCYRFVDMALEEAGEEYAVISGHQAPMTFARLLRGTKDFLIDFYRDPRFTEKLMDFSMELAQRICDRYVEHGIEILHFNDDLGDTHGPFVAPELFKRLVVPRFKNLFNRYRSKGVKILLHADGAITPLLPDLIDCGIDALNPLDTAAGVSLEHVKENFGDRISLFGGVDENILFLGTPQQVAETVREDLNIAAPGGGYILASGAANILKGVPIANFLAMIETGKKYGRYHS